MTIFRADFYITIRVSDFSLGNSSERLFNILDNLSVLQNIQMTIVRQNKQIHGRTIIKEWYEITGSMNIPESGNSFWVLSKNSTQEEPYNFFMRVDRNITDEDYEGAQRNALKWVKNTLLEPIKRDFSIEELEFISPVKLKK